MLPILSIFLDTLAPVFILVTVGYIVGTRFQLDPRTLSRLAYWVLAPGFILDTFLKASLDFNSATRMMGFYFVVTAGSVIAAFLAGKLLRQPDDMVAAFVLVTAFGNVGNFGLSVVQFQSGEQALAVGSVYFLAGNIFGFIVGTLAATWHKSNRWEAVRSAFLNPAIIAAVVAVAIKQLGIELPVFLGRSVGLVAQAMVPMTIVALGVQFGTLGRPRLNGSVAVAGMVRLVVSPLLGFALAAPFALSAIERTAGIVQVSMPAAVFTALLAIEHDLHPQFVTTAVFLSTLFSAFTLTAVLALV